MQTNRTTLVIILTVYLVSLFFMIGAMSETIAIDYTSTSQSIGTSINFLGMEIGFGDSFLGNIILGVASLPLWFNALFITLPATVLGIFIVLMFIPTIPSG